MANILPRDLPIKPSLAQEAVVIVDDGSGVWKSRLKDIAPGPLFTEINALQVPSNIKVIRSAGFAIAGKGIARYKRSVAGLASWGQNVWWTQSLDGAYWEIAESTPTSDMFGTVGDAARAYGSQTVTGTDVTSILNKLTYYAETIGNGVCMLSRGAHMTTDTIHVGTGINGFRSVHLVGEVDNPWATRHDSQTAFPSAEIKAAKNDRPAISVQGARSSSVRHISIEGPLYAGIINAGLGRSDGGETVNDVARATWLPGTGPHTNGVNNPGAGIAVDPFAGSASGITAYPTVAYPVTAPQYGKPYSSEVTLIGVKMSGFSCGVVVQPCNADGNGDFVRLQNCSTSECIFGVSVGNSQSRNVEIRNHNFAHVHTFLTNNQHGKQRGKFGGPIDNVSGGQCVQLFDLNMGFAGSVTFTGAYAEGMWRFGDAVGVGRISIDGEFIMVGSSGTAGNFNYRGFPRTHFGTTAFPNAAGGGGVADCALALRGILQLAEVAVFAGKNIDTSGLRIISAVRDGSSTLTGPIAAGHNALGGGVFAASNPYDRSTSRMGGAFLLMDATTGNAVSAATWDGRVWKRSRRAQGCPLTAQALACVQSNSEVAIPAVTKSYDNASLTSKSLIDRTLTFTIAGISTLADRYYLGLGDVIFHDASASIFIITSRSGDNLTATLLNGFLNTAGAFSFPNGAPTLSEGTFYFYTGRHYLPDYPVFGDLVASSTTISNVGTAEGYFGVDTDFVNGDGIANAPMEEFTLNPAATVSSRDSTAKTITLSVAAVANQTKRRLMFRRAA